MKLYGHPHRHTTILTAHLPDLLSAWDSAPEWWFLPYRDPEHHLRLRIRLPSADAFGEAAHCVGAWAAGLRRAGLIGHIQLDTYYPETGRFGSGTAMTAAEAVFAADSAAAIAQRIHTGRGGAPHQHALTAASLVDLTVSFLGDVGDGMRWLIDHVARTSPRHPTGSSMIRRYAWRTRAMSGPRGAPPPAGNTLPPRGRGDAPHWPRTATPSPTREISAHSVLLTLLHLHSVRMAGIAPDTERVCHRLARAAVLSWTTRTRGTT